jgi:DNA-binding response OmpR family regulator
MPKINKKILIVEDDKSLLWILRQGFSDEGFVVAFAQNGEEGLNIAELENPDLILLDISMPVMDGLTMAKKLRAKNINSQIIFLTNFKDGDHISEAIEISSEIDYIIKSDLDIDQIIGRVKERLGIK